MKSIRAIIIDDEPLACQLLQEMLRKHPEIDIVTVCHDGFVGLKEINQHKPDLIFLDIQMPKITGIEMLELLDDPPKVIFTTAYDDYAIKAFEVNAVDYLLKPYAPERLASALEKVLNRKSNESAAPTTSALATAESAARIVVKEGNSIKVIPVRDVMYLEAASDYVKVFTKERYFLKHGTMHHFEEILAPSNFIRIHRSFLMNTDYINKVELYEKGGHCVILKNNTVLPVSKSGYTKLKEFLK